MKEIKLGSKKYPGKVALVDDDMFEYLNQWEWYAKNNGHTFYAMRGTSIKEGKRKIILMHRVILGLTDTKIWGDHKDHDGLNNQLNNLRIVTYSQSNANKRSRGLSKYLGVYFEKRSKKRPWISSVKKGTEKFHLGSFANQEEAALAYNKKASEIFGEFANLNKILP